MSSFSRFREWQSESIGHTIYLNARQKVEDIIRQQKPELTVQLEGISLLEHYPKQGYFYHVSEDAYLETCGYTLEAEQGFLPFRDQSVDLLILNHTIELYQDHGLLFKEVERVLAVDGKVFVMVLVNRWLGANIATKYIPLGNIAIMPQSMRKLKKVLSDHELGIWEEYSLMSDPQAVMMTQRLKETLIYPMGLEIGRITPDWNNYVGIL